MIGTFSSNDGKVTIIGGGIAGLLMAYHLDQQGYEVRLIESQKRLGGLLQTHQTPWGMVEAAAHSLLATSAVRKLCAELEVELLPVNPNSKTRFILRDGKMKRFPLTLRETFEAFQRASGISRRAHSTGLNDLNSESNSLSIGAWADRHLGIAARKYLITPMVHGIYAANPDEISLQAAFPQLQVAQGHSLLGSQIKKLKSKKPNKHDKPKMVALRHGMGSLVDILESQLRDRLKDRLILNSHITELPECKNLVLSVPAWVAGQLLEHQDSKLSDALKKVSYTPLISVTVFIERKDLMRTPCGVGVLMPEDSPSQCLGILFNSSSFSGRVTNEEKWISCTVMLGGSKCPDLLQYSDSEIKKIIEKEFQFLFGLKGEISGMVIHRWPKAIPKYNDHLIKVWELAKSGWCSQPGKVLFGNYTGAVSLRGMIESLFC